MNYRWIIFLGALLAAMGVASGAIGAHLLEKRFEENKIAAKQVEQYETAVRYQIYHALGLILIGALAQAHPSRWLAASAVAMICGCLLFCGGLYGYIAAVTVPLPPLIFLKHVIPFGGGLFILSWMLLAVGTLANGKPIA